MFRQVDILWLLDVVCDHREPLEAIYSADGGDDYYFGMFNRKSHGLNLPDLCSLLSFLFAEGTIAAWSTTNVLLPQQGVGHQLSLPEIQQCLMKNQKRKQADPRATLEAVYWYGLTSKGGATWETLAKPSWQEYVSRAEYAVASDDSGGKTFGLGTYSAVGPRRRNRPQSPLEEVTRVELESLNNELLEKLLDRDQRIYRVVNADSIVRRQLTDWNATYWKTFGQARQITYNLLPESSFGANGATVADYAALTTLLDRWPRPLSKNKSAE